MAILENDFKPEKNLAKVMNDRLVRVAKELQEVHFKPLSGRGFSSDDRPKKAFASRPRTKPGSLVYYRELRRNLGKTIANIPIPESAIKKPGFSGHQQ